MKHSGQAKILNMSNTFHKNDEFTNEFKNFKEIFKNQDNQSSRFALDSLANRNPLVKTLPQQWYVELATGIAVKEV